jgi:hypothetical protein
MPSLRCLIPVIELGGRWGSGNAIRDVWLPTIRQAFVITEWKAQLTWYSPRLNGYIPSTDPAYPDTLRAYWEQWNANREP